MPEAVSFFADLSIVIVVASAVGLVFSRLNLPLTVGYILAGIIVGPNVRPALISDEANIRMLSDLGVMFLMFSIGMGFSFRRVRQMGSSVVFPAIWDVAFMVLGGFGVGKLLGWGNLECFLLGLILCDSSTSIAAKTLDGLGWLGKRFADSTFAIALIEDVLAILLIAVLNGVSGGTVGVEGAGFWGAAADIGRQMGVLALFLVGVTVFGILLVPRLMNYVTERFDDEIVLMAALGVCFGVSCLAQNGLNLSLVVGAFLAGAIIAEARARRRIERVVKPVTNLFGAVFFVSVGLMVEPLILWDNLGAVVFITVAMIVLKLINNAVACILVGETPRDAFKVGIGMGQVAEFSFIIAGIAMADGLSKRPLYQIAVGVALLCTATNPYLLRASDRLYALTARGFGSHARDLLHWYRRWITSLAARRAEGGVSMTVHIRNHAILLGVNLAMILILFAGVYVVARIPAVTAFFGQLDREWLPGAGRIPWSGLLCSAAALLISAPTFWAAQHIWSEIARHVADDAFVGVGRRLVRVRRLIKSTLRLVGWGFLVAYAAVLCSGFLRNMWVLAVIVLAAGGFVAYFSRRFRGGYAEAHEILTRAFDVNALPPEDPVSIGALIAVHTETVTLPRGAGANGRTLGELDLRGITGAAVISVCSRRGGLNVSPGRDTVLTSGDTLVIVGSDVEIAKASAFLSRRG